MIGPKTKVCTVLLLLFPSFLTYLVLEGPQRNAVQALALVATVIMSYITVVLIQDYYWLKSHPSTKGLRRDIHLFKPLVNKKSKKGAN